MFKHNGKDISGERFGRLTAIEPIGKTKAGNIIWRCKCDCGNIKDVSTKYLGHGTSSCGCYKREVHADMLRTHGKSDSKLFPVWNTMIGRCTNPNAHEYENYGGRGIKVCDEWQSFENFYEWAIANGYDENSDRKNSTLDRINVDGNYEPLNCRFVSMKTQQRNKRSNVLVTYNGETHCLSEWAEIAGIRYGTFLKRIYAGWSMEDAMTKPLVYTR